MWAGVCASTGSCGWVAADYLFSPEPGDQNLGMYTITATEVAARKSPSMSAEAMGNIFYSNRVMVVDVVRNREGEWARVCRLESCAAWIPANVLTPTN